MEENIGPDAAALRLKMVELVEPWQWHRPPFDRFQYESDLDALMPYIEEYPESERERLIQATIANKRIFIGGNFFNDPEAHAAVKALREKWAKGASAKGQSSKSNVRDTGMTFKDLKKVLVAVMKERLPDYPYEKLPKERYDDAIITFAKPFFPGSKLLISFDRGTMMPHHFTPMIGLTEPWYHIGPGLFFGRNRWTYSSEAECKKAIHEIVDVIEKLMPILIDQAKEALAHRFSDA
jgi:hypothetical protein